MILSTPCAKKRKCRICTNKRTAALTNKPRFVEPGFAVWANRKYCLSAFAVRRNREHVLSGFAIWLKQKHWLPVFVTRRKREYGLARLVMTEPSSLTAQNLFRQFFRYLSCSPGQELFLRTAKNYKPVSHFCSNGRTFISTQRSRLFPKAEMSGLFPSDNWSAKRRPSPPAVLSVPDSPVFQKTDGR